MAVHSVPVLNGEVPVVADSVPRTGAVEEYSAPPQANGEHAKQNGSLARNITCDALVVGAGFSGVTAIHRFRKIGLDVKCFEAGADLGGTWYWNRYPGACVDSEMPFYQLNIPEVYRGFNFSTRFPDGDDLRRYFAHLDKVLDLKRDMTFNARVVEATWDKDTAMWTVKTRQGHVARCKYLTLATGMLHRTYTPDFVGLSDYKGEVYHSGAWPESYIAKGKKVAVFGVGASGVQITQVLGKEAEHLSVLVRRPRLPIPMRQRIWTEEEQHAWKLYYPTLFKAARESYSGFPAPRLPAGVQDVTKEERESHWEAGWKRGGLGFLVSNYSNITTDKEANRMMYEFWAKKVRERLTDPAKHKIMAPEKQPVYFSTVPATLETDYFEVLNQPNVSILDLSANPLKGFYEKGLVMADDSHHEFDTVVFATGFDTFTGTLTQLGLKSKEGVDIADIWDKSINTYLGLTIHGFPNLFLCYNAQAPTGSHNGPTIIEAQVDIITTIIAKMQAEHYRTIEPTREAQAGWRAMLDKMMDKSLLKYTDSWWNGGNIPGKSAETLTYAAGIAHYEAHCRKMVEELKGFDLVREDA